MNAQDPAWNLSPLTLVKEIFNCLTPAGEFIGKKNLVPTTYY